MDGMSPQQQQDGLSLSLSREAAPQEDKRRMKSQSYRRQSAPSLVITKALNRSKTLSRESFLVPVCPETCPLVQSFLTASDRSFLLHGHAQLRTGMQTQDRHLFLFTDILVTAKAKSANHYKQKARVRVCEMWTAGCTDEVCEGSTDPEKSFVMGWPTCNYVATFSSEEQKEKWLALLKSRMREEKEREETKTIPLRVYGKGLDAFAVTKTLPVSNSDSTNEVVRLALQQFNIIGNVKDYQLWVLSKRDNVPYPLIGHEFPFSIQMSHVGNAGGSRDAAAPPAARQVYKQCQFILKPRPTLHASAEKPFKRRRSLMTWAFWRGSSSHLNELSVSASRGCLFGHPLSSLCVEDTLPKPVMEMLSFLYSEGSWTRGIFRRPAGARSVRELRDSLDNGGFQLPLTRDHVYVIAGVFKDFLRSIPGGLLCCELHEEWMDVLEEEEKEEEHVRDIQRMIYRLPKGNALLLRYLLAMLHSIQGNAKENQMTSFNLSVCIAPSLLWPPSAPCSPEVEGEGTKKVCELVKFMIEHCEQILGEDPSSLFGGPPQRPDTDEIESDSWLDPLTDSSYDSLENELDNICGSPGVSRGRRKPKRLQGSLDSILTFSDDNQDADPDTHRRKTDNRSDLKLRPLEGAGRRDSDFCSPSQHAPNERWRRRSEPAIAYAVKFGPAISRGETNTEVSYAPAPPDSVPDSADTLHSLSCDHTWATRRGLRPTKTHEPSISPSPSAPFLLTAGGCADQGTSPPREQLNWGTLKGCRGLHPNCWLKKGRMLSQQDNLEKEDEDKTGGGSSDGSFPHRKLGPERGRPGETRGGKLNPGSQTKSQQLQHEAPRYHSSESLLSVGQLHGTESKSLFNKQSGPTLSLFKKNKSRSLEEQCNARVTQGRPSERGRQVMERGSTPTRARLPSDPGLKVTEVDSQRGVTEARFCLSPCATKAVRDYFSSHPCSNAQSSQQVALALVESHRQWLKRCSDATAEPDLDQLLFAEESYV